MILIMKTLNATHARSAVRKREIIIAALACFTKKGFTETSIADICKKARASTGSVYHHFKSKGRLASAIYLEGIRDYQSGMIESLSAQNNARDGIYAIIRFHLFWVKDNPDWARFLFQKRHAEYMDDSEDEMKRLNTEFAANMSGWFKGHIQSGDIRPLPRDVMIALLLGPCQEFSRMFVSASTGTHMPEAAEALAAAAWSALSPPA